MTDLLAAGRFKTTPVKVAERGLADVPHWLQYMRDGKVYLCFL
jgi:hypothetical protein